MNFFLPKVYASFVNHNLQYFSLPFKQYVMFHISYFPHRSPPPCWGKETRELYSGCTIMALTGRIKLISLSIYQGQRSTKQVRTCLKKNCYFFRETNIFLSFLIEVLENIGFSKDLWYRLV